MARIDIAGNFRSLFPNPGEARNLSLDGLRGVAILLVLASHTSAGRFPLGGMIGVTLFFVLSGYLITDLLLREQATTGRIRFLIFYWHRALRLLPALLVVLLFTPVALWILRDPRLGADLIPASLSALLYVSDFVRASGDAMVVLGHTWSLAVEEQFYFIWPALLILVILRWVPKKVAFWILLGLAIVLAAWRVVAAASFGFDRTYFSLDTNAFGLVFGACLALRPSSIPANAATALTIASVTGLFVFAVLPSDMGPTYYMALTYGAPVAALLALLAIIGALTGSKPFTVAPLVFFGRISYGLYLWHEVILLSQPDGGAIEGVWRVVAALVAVALAVASWVFVERPASRYRNYFGPVVVDVSGRSISTVGAIR
jgi:peptidoglycan/LPS O-acetylase OafA/YrhL